MNARRLLVSLFSSLGIAALAWPSAHAPVARIVYNPSDSVPRGWYRIGSADSLHVGSIVLANLPANAAALAAQRGYLPEHIPLLKRIGAMSPQQVCIDDRIVRIDGVAVADVRAADGRGHPLSVWQQCRRLRNGELFLLSTTNPASFDSRYFGPVAVPAVIGSAQPLWTWNTP
jgi:conjugative transfer signal peptidase TraF